MSPFGKIVTIGIALVTGTSLLTGVTTAYMLRSTVPADNMVATSATAPVQRAPATRVVPAVSRTSVDTPRPIPVATPACDWAQGGGGCGQGALNGGLVGTAAGAGYGVYNTQKECGTIFGNSGFTDAGPVPSAPARGRVTEAAFRPGSAGDITIYNAR